ncbi:MAG: DNA-binding response regulator [Candidatus Melainabacteria bacterium RIFOXYA12_FULL_32_12]|nr:MAG: DNA-binding response regulator [Candidatus Melainabacteria bacterium GWF2_32_7]OGI17419.1 MAG: DNA-binding response regulator [Candidatus Melainabacteria bacterium RIFOXYA2_FULL_32_9]OGI27485.1 MAG: DNA-binding response regulator [Candidatus Melainabacteria bacterium RIFOXYA12_FULL_32_12]
MSKILVIDDDISILELLEINLELLGHEVVTSPDGIKGFALAQQEVPDLIILDIMMPEVDGYTVAQRIRHNKSTKNIPILMLTALGMLKDKVQGFDSGVDDYLVKPFELEELKLRVRALLRRSGSLPESLTIPEILTVGDITLVPENLTAKLNNQDVKLTPIEFEILNNLVQKHGQAVSAGSLLKEVWGYSQDDDIETIRVHIRHLRTKLEKASPDKKYIETIYGGGYRLIPYGSVTPTSKS